MVERSLAQVLTKRGNGHVLTVRPDHAVVFFQGAEETACVYCSDAKEYLERYLSIRVNFSKSAACGNLGDVRPAYQAVISHRGVESRIIVLAKRFIRESFADPGLSLAGVADKAGVSKNHLSWEFARETGETLTEYVARVRIEEAKRLFSTTRLKVYEVAERVGISERGAFQPCFQESGREPARAHGLNARRAMARLIRPDSSIRYRASRDVALATILLSKLLYFGKSVRLPEQESFTAA